MLLGRKTSKRKQLKVSSKLSKKKNGKLNLKLKNPKPEEINEINGKGKVVIHIKKRWFEEVITVTGTIKNGKLEGEGKIVKETTKHLRGVIKRKTYQKGTFKDNKLHGEGEMGTPSMLYSGTFKNGDIVFGKIHNKISKFVEEGTFKTNNNNSFFKDVKLHGKGKTFGKNFSSEGIFVNGLLKSGKRESKNNEYVLEEGEFTIKKGSFESNLRRGRRVHKDGTVEEGIFKTVYKKDDFEYYPITTLEKKQKIF